MGNEIVKISPSLDIQVSYPNGTMPSVVEAACIAILGIGTSLIRQGIYATGAIIEALDDTRVKITMKREKNRQFIEYYIPTLALYEATQMGRNFVNASNWDEDLKRMALEDINRILTKYQVK